MPMSGTGLLSSKALYALMRFGIHMHGNKLLKSHMLANSRGILFGQFAKLELRLVTWDLIVQACFPHCCVIENLPSTK